MYKWMKISEKTVDQMSWKDKKRVDFSINELTRRLEALQRENNKLKAESNMLKDKYRDVENDYNTTQRKLEERGELIPYQMLL